MLLADSPCVGLYPMFDLKIWPNFAMASSTVLAFKGLSFGFENCLLCRAAVNAPKSLVYNHGGKPWRKGPWECSMILEYSHQHNTVFLPFFFFLLQLCWNVDLLQPRDHPKEYFLRERNDAKSRRNLCGVVGGNKWRLFIRWEVM